MNNIPTIKYYDGDKLWCLNNKPHRTDGPAIEGVDGYKAWLIYGKRYSEVEFNYHVKTHFLFI